MQIINDEKILIDELPKLLEIIKDRYSDVEKILIFKNKTISESREGFSGLLVVQLEFDLSRVYLQRMMNGKLHCETAEAETVIKLNNFKIENNPLISYWWYKGEYYTLGLPRFFNLETGNFILLSKEDISNGNGFLKYKILTSKRVEVFNVKEKNNNENKSK